MRMVENDFAMNTFSGLEYSKKYFSAQKRVMVKFTKDCRIFLRPRTVFLTHLYSIVPDTASFQKFKENC